MTPTWSIVTAVRNGMPHVRECVESVRAQGAALEHIVCDGGSTDGTIEYLRGLHGVRLIEGPDEGQADALRKGFAAARGTYLGWLNADDRLLPGALARIAGAFERHPDAALVSGDGRFIDEDGTPGAAIHGTPADARTILFRMVLQPSTFIRREAYEAAGGIDPSLRFHMDAELYARLLERGPMVRVPEVWSEYRLHVASKTVSSPASFVLEWRGVLERRGLPTAAAVYEVAAAGSEPLHLTVARSERVREGLERETDAPTASWILGTVLLRAGDTDEAERRLAAAAEGGTPAVRLHARREILTLAHARRDLGAARSAAAACRETAHAMPELDDPAREVAWATYLVASLEETLGLLDEAEAGFRSVLAVEPPGAPRYGARASFHLGRILERKGRWTEAEEAFRACLQAEPGHRGARAALSR